MTASMVVHITNLTPPGSECNPTSGGYYARPFFSIVMAAYNQGKFIDETVKSVIGQSYERWELIIVNDGSKDDSWQRANALMAGLYTLACS
jgi:cellulose synthase/poly-beta-1,6-N-acetylglucosamine synthase-like glycosyltransferase